ncbi:hypothetical protein HMI55_003119 [Coelomomyces lativittatus]|nr:hypothetical protein HMI55_003119 [Coelomomyces lativittatus]
MLVEAILNSTHTLQPSPSPTNSHPDIFKSLEHVCTGSLDPHSHLSASCNYPTYNPSSLQFSSSFHKEKIHSMGGTICLHCGTSETPTWRRASSGKLICNACGIVLRHIYFNPFFFFFLLFFFSFPFFL